MKKLVILDNLVLRLGQDDQGLNKYRVYNRSFIYALYFNEIHVSESDVYYANFYVSKLAESCAV
jgi:hypothetical protein